MTTFWQMIFSHQRLAFSFICSEPCIKQRFNACGSRMWATPSALLSHEACWSNMGLLISSAVSLSNLLSSSLQTLCHPFDSCAPSTLSPSPRLCVSMLSCSSVASVRLLICFKGRGPLRHLQYFVLFFRSAAPDGLGRRFLSLDRAQWRIWIHKPLWGLESQKCLPELLWSAVCLVALTQSVMRETVFRVCQHYSERHEESELCIQAPQAQAASAPCGQVECACACTHARRRTAARDPSKVLEGLAVGLLGKRASRQLSAEQSANSNNDVVLIIQIYASEDKCRVWAELWERFSFWKAAEKTFLERPC